MHNPIDTTRSSAHELVEGSLIYDPCVLALWSDVQIGRELTDPTLCVPHVVALWCVDVFGANKGKSKESGTEERRMHDVSHEYKINLAHALVCLSFVQKLEKISSDKRYKKVYL